MPKPCSLIVDASNLLCRSAFALPRLTLDDDDSTPCGGAWGMINQITAAMDKTDANEVHVCWDGGRSPRRLAVFPEYKAHRSRNPEHTEKMQLVWNQASIADDVLKSAGCWLYRANNVEADDVIALLARSVAHRGRDAVIVSNDADFLQLVNPDGIMVLTADERMWQAGKCRTALIGDAALATKVFMGCSSDNIPGIPGIGGTRAANIREAVLADCQTWNVSTLFGIMRGEYNPPDAGDNKTNKAVSIMRQTFGNGGEEILARNELLCDLSAACEWEEIGLAAMNPIIHENPCEQVFEETCDHYGWKHARFAQLLRAGAI